MLRRIQLLERRGTNSGWWLLLLQGVLLVALAGLIVYDPTVLVHVAAALLAAVGLFSIALALAVRRVGRATYQYSSAWWWGDMIA
jgi:uncharacterized membrane protein HdeD (DUF308 family)